MKYVRTYESFKSTKFSNLETLNEEFIGGLIKGALSKLFNLFSEPFKDLANDIKKMFKEDDLGTVKDIIMTNFNQAIDNAQKEIPKINEEGALTDLMPKMIEQLVNLANNIEKDVTQGLGKDKTTPFTNAAKSVILGNKEAKWPGLVGALDPNNAVALKFNGGIKINYKFNKAAYDKALTDAGAKGGANALKAKKDAANKFLDNLQKDVAGYIEKELTDDELKDIYSKAGGKSEGGVSDELLKSYGVEKVEDLVGKEVRYKTKEFDKNKKPEEQPDKIGKLKVLSVEKDGLKLDGKEADFVKKMEEILPGESAGENAKKAAETLGKIKGDEEKMAKVAKFADFIQDEKNKDKLAEIEKMMSGESQA
jgi:hypothetical protein